MRATYRSFAKINLHLEVLGVRPDGYHELSTVFQTVDLHDRVSLEVGGRGVDLEVVGHPLPSDERNLARQAATSFLAAWPLAGGARMTLEKRIPVGGGLGGGSSNAATVLLGLRELLGAEQATHADLEELARALGADVPYFLTGGTALGVGRGDEIVALPDLAPREMWLVTPRVEVSTAEVFRDFGELTAHREVSSMGRLSWEEGADWQMVDRAWNDLEPSVVRRFPEVRRVYNALVEAGAGLVRLSGSGATWIASFEESVGRADLESRLPSSCRVFHVRTLNRSALRRLRVVQ
jgi:4-diphosphocytidyl-2-C-methyl-D-erythritol kinase